MPTSKITIEQTKKAISIIRRYKNLPRSKGLIQTRLNKKFGIKGGQANFLMVFVATERIKRNMDVVR